MTTAKRLQKAITLLLTLRCVQIIGYGIRTRKTSNTDNFHALFGKLESKNLQVELKQIQMQTRGKYLASLYNQSALSENVFILLPPNFLG